MAQNHEKDARPEEQKDHPEHKHHPEPEHFEIQIDRHHYKVTQRHMTGMQLRHLPTPPIGPDRDLFEVVPGGSDRKIGDDEEVEIRNGLRFFTAPAQINPGLDTIAGEHCRAAAH
jgi:hypothetical protein